MIRQLARLSDRVISPGISHPKCPDVQGIIVALRCRPVRAINIAVIESNFELCTLLLSDRSYLAASAIERDGNGEQWRTASSHCCRGREDIILSPAWGTNGRVRFVRCRMRAGWRAVTCRGRIVPGASLSPPPNRTHNGDNASWPPIVVRCRNEPPRVTCLLLGDN